MSPSYKLFSVSSSSRGLAPRDEPNPPVFRIRWPITPPVDVSYNHLMAKYETELETEKRRLGLHPAPITLSPALGPLYPCVQGLRYSTHAAKNMTQKNVSTGSEEKKQETCLISGPGTPHHPFFLAVMTSQSTLCYCFSEILAKLVQLTNGYKSLYPKF
ncbi:unnamed protein product [Caenorhabditis nigoni]